MKVLCLAIALTAVYLADVEGHGALHEPPSRNSAFRFGFNTPADYDDMSHMCGNYTVDEDKCGVCGNTNSECPSQSYCKNVIVRTYKSGATIPVTVHMSGNHGGIFQFRLCPSSNGAATWDCMEKNRLKVVEAANQPNSKSGTMWQEADMHEGDVNVHVQLPNIKCERCVFQWHWTAAQFYGTCANGTKGQGCGPQQTYLACSDIKIE